MDPFGKRERKLADVSVVASLRFRYLAWSADSKEVILVDQSPPAEAGSLFAVLIETGAKRQLTVPPAGTYIDFSPALSPTDAVLPPSERALGIRRAISTSLIRRGIDRPMRRNARHLFVECTSGPRVARRDAHGPL